jgi:hypothetical protein
MRRVLPQPDLRGDLHEHFEPLDRQIDVEGRETRRFLPGVSGSSFPAPYTGTLPPVGYPGHFLVKRVTNAGTIRLKKRLLFLSNALLQHVVGLEAVDDGIWSIHFCRVLLGRVDERDYVIRPRL